MTMTSGLRRIIIQTGQIFVSFSYMPFSTATYVQNCNFATWTRLPHNMPTAAAVLNQCSMHPRGAI